MTETGKVAHSSRTWWPLAAAGVLVVLGVGRLVLDATATAAGSSVSCGGALSWMIGADGGARTTFLAGRTFRLVCGAPLHNASIEGSAAIVVGMVLALGWLVAVRARRPFASLAATVLAATVRARRPVAVLVATARALWPFAMLAALIGFFLGLFTAGPIAGVIVALVLLTTFSLWPTFHRHRRAN